MSRARIALMLIIAAGVPGTCLAGSFQDDIHRGNTLYAGKNFDEALNRYAQALRLKPDSDIAHFNSGAARYKKKEYAQAVESFNQALGFSEESTLEAKANYNLGNSAYRTGESRESKDPEKALSDYRAALDYYKRSMELDPDDIDPKFNYEFVASKIRSLSQKMQEKQKQSSREQESRQDQKESPQGGKGERSEQSQESKGKQDNAPSGKEEKQESSAQHKNESGQGAQQQEQKNQQEKQEGQDGDRQENQKSKSQEEKGDQGKPKEKQKESGQESSGEQPEGQQQGEEEKKDQQKDKDGLSFYQKEIEPREMTKEEANMLLEGLEEEEAATRKEVRFLRRKKADYPETRKDW